MDSYLGDSIADSSRRWPDRPALTHDGRTMSYAELDAHVAALATSYRELGIAAGERIVCQLSSNTEHVIAMAAAWAAGAVHVGAHPDLTGAELAAVVAQTGAAALLYQPRPNDADPLASIRAVRAVRPTVQIAVHNTDIEDGSLRLADMLKPRSDGVPGSSDPTVGPGPAILLRTSGTTGAPKAVVETLPAMWAKALFFAEMMQPGTDDVHLMYLPVSHAFGMTLVLLALATGGHLVLAERFSPERALQLIGDHGVTVLPGTPTHFTLLLRALDTSRHRVKTVRWAASAAAPLTPALTEEIYERLGVEILHVYGCSEGFLTATTDPDAIRLGSAGSRIFRGPDGTPPDGSVVIVDIDRDVHLAQGVIGEIAYGAAHPVRYWDAPAVATDGWYRTGDLGYVDAGGRVFVTGRIKELINRGGLKVSCGEIECALQDLSAVDDCAVVASPDPVLGEAICACVVPATGSAATLSEIRSQLGGVLARHKLPDELCLVESIPRTSVGKINRAVLRDQVIGSDIPRIRFRDAPGHAV